MRRVEGASNRSAAWRFHREDHDEKSLIGSSVPSQSALARWIEAANGLLGKVYVDGHTKLVIGGAATVAMSVAVVVAVAVSTAVALTDAPGARVTQAALLVPSSSAKPSPVPTPLETSTAMAETVPAIAPAVIPPPAQVPQAPRVAASDPEQDVAERWRKSGDWTAAREWAATRGWSTERVEAWIAEMEDGRDDRDGYDRDGRDDRDRADRDGYRRTAPQTPAIAGDTSDDDHEWSHRGSKKEQSPASPDRRD